MKLFSSVVVVLLVTGIPTAGVSAGLELTVSVVPNDPSLRVQPTLQPEQGAPITTITKSSIKFIYEFSKIVGLEKSIVVKIMPNDNRYTHADLSISLVREQEAVTLPLATTVISQKFDGGQVRHEYKLGTSKLSGTQLINLYQMTESFLNERFSSGRARPLTRIAENEVRLLVLHAEVLANLRKKMPWIDAPSNIEDRRNLLAEAERLLKAKPKLRERLNLTRLQSAENLLWEVEAKKYARWWRSSILYEIQCLDRYPLIVKFDQKMQEFVAPIRDKIYQIISLRRLEVLLAQSRCLEELASREDGVKRFYRKELTKKVFAGNAPTLEINNLITELLREVKQLSDGVLKNRSNGHIDFLRSILKDLS